MELKNHKSILIDANFLVKAVDLNTSKDDIARIDNLFASLQKSRGRLIIPMPALAEYLVEADIARVEFFDKLEKRSYIFVAPFDRVVAFECANMDRAAR